MTKRILFVCLGNICRSPTAKGVLRSIAPEIHCDSAGTGGWHVGEPPYGPMQQAAKKRGYDLSHLSARQFRPNDFGDFDLIIVMDDNNRQAVEQLRPPDSRTPVKLLSSYLDEPEWDHVPDPYYTQTFDLTLDIIERALANLKGDLA
ncbi:Low molecular weight protein-tyrosine-phosphatase YfkJ [Roseovarius albus]|uniref:protein-tyrosine-phosphatase n=1 Tax=Roseovarius albus TaxID=1247867 RepID=A0A1X6Y9R4_9RHOB|nr:low molecular weight protein-tyrosine-phosphatase [Roseovarius albus]SLN14856.1 Low molecular weight protein-tyrosine-phosphatase YfkJ [Roseovarius albus]